MQLTLVLDVLAKAQVDVLRQPGSVPKTHFERHASLEDPPVRRGSLEAGHQAFEEHPPAEPVEGYAGGVGLGEQPMFERGAQRLGVW
jgi:hypothetical protein